ncbi:MAG: septum formation initiator family protein [Firmicutes bacterium]|nr:septum formation initiator family protein [Bacillota bacterium]MBQ9604931.1 septum formation initiator family protein [Bacillota bacterium]
MIALYIKAADLYEYKSQLAQAKKEQQQAVDKNLSLMYEITYQDTDAYIEKVARERLNLVKPNEIVYIDENK